MLVALSDDDPIKNDTKKINACPKCKTENNFRIRRSYFVKTFLFWLPIRRYACYSCKNKYYVFR